MENQLKVGINKTSSSDGTSRANNSNNINSSDDTSGANNSNNINSSDDTSRANNSNNINSSDDTSRANNSNNINSSDDDSFDDTSGANNNNNINKTNTDEHEKELLERIMIREENGEKNYMFYSQINDKITVDRYIRYGIPICNVKFTHNEMEFETNSEGKNRFFRRYIVFDFPEAILFTPDTKYKFMSGFPNYLIEKKFNIPTKDQDLIIEQHDGILPTLTFYKEVDPNTKIEWYKIHDKPRLKVIFNMENKLYAAADTKSCESTYYSVSVDDDYLTLRWNFFGNVNEKKIKRKLNRV